MTDPTGHSECGVGQYHCAGDSPPLPEWWTSEGFARVYVEGYGIFDEGHLRRGHRSGEHLMEQIRAAMEAGGGKLPIPPSSNSKFWGDFVINYAISGDVSDEQLEGVAWGIYMNFEFAYEKYQSNRLFPLSRISAFAPEDPPSDYLGFWAGINGLPIESVPLILESLGNVNVSTIDNFAFNQVAFNLNLANAHQGGIGISIPRNYEFNPMAPLVVMADPGITITWQNVAWPSYLQVAPIESNEETWWVVD
jgi:hypothetical protein